MRIYKRNQRANREAIELIKEGEFRRLLEQEGLPSQLAKQYDYADKNRRRVQ